MNTLIDTARIAEILGMSRNYVRANIAKRPGFPEPDRTDGGYWWDAAKVAEFLTPTCPEIFTKPSAPPAKPPNFKPHLNRITTDTARRCAVNGRAFSIPRSLIGELFEAQGRRCAVSGIAFDLHRPIPRAPAPFSPSIDRIDSERGYEAGNVRLVCNAINLLMNVWGDKVFDRIASHIREKNDHPH